MALANTCDAIGAVTRLLQNRLSSATGLNVSVGRPDAAAGPGSSGDKLNLFLYQIGFDPYMKNVSLDEGQPAPLWTVLHYLVTAYDTDKDSDSIDAHMKLGRGLAALQALNYVRPSDAAPLDAPLTDNPEPLKITFDNADVELLSKLMQGSDEKYRVSAAFQVRPVMIAVDQPPAYAPAVLSVGPPSSPGVVVMPSLGPRLDPLQPEKFEAGAQLALRGADLGGVTEVCFGDVCYPATLADGALSVTVPATTDLSPGMHGIAAVRVLPSGRRLRSNAVLGRLLPTLVSATVGTLTPAGPGLLHGSFTLTGRCLGGPDDDIYVALYADGRCALMLEAAGVAAQDTLTIVVQPEQALPAGTYYVILRVNGEQAPASLAVNWS